MAYVSQELKKSLSPAIMSILKKYGLTGSLRVRNHMTLMLTVRGGRIDFLSNYSELGGFEKTEWIDVNPYHFQKHFTGKALDFLTEVHEAMNVGNYDNSDIMTDYFSVGWYTNIQIGQWDKPYKFVG